MSIEAMRALQIDRYGGEEVLRLREVEIPAPGPREVLVKLAFAGINFMDVHTRNGKYATSRNYTTELPLTLGVEGAGWVEAVGSEAEEWKKGDRVAYCLARGSYAEYAIVPAWRLVTVPESISLDLAAAALFQGYTAHYLAHDIGCLRPGRSCIVHAGSGGIAQILIQFAKSLGAVVIATASSAQKAETAGRRGADAVVSYDGAAFVARAREMTGGQGVDVVFDSVGPATIKRSMAALRRRGLLVLYGSNSGPVPVIEPMELADAGSLYFTRPRLADYVTDGEAVRRRGEALFRALDSGDLQVEIQGRYSFDTVHEAHRALEERRSIGKSVLRIAG